MGPTTPFGEVEQAALQHLVGGGTDARHGGRAGIEGRLFEFAEIVFAIASHSEGVKFDRTIV
jgi:hypothetical protein